MGINDTLASFFKNISGHQNQPKPKHRRVSKTKVTVTYGKDVEKDQVKVDTNEAKSTATSKQGVGSQKMQVKVQIEKKLMKNFVGVASKSSNSLGAFLYGAPVRKNGRGNSSTKKLKLQVDTAFIPSQKAGKYVVKVKPNASGKICAPYDSVANEAAIAAGIGNENCAQSDTALAAGPVNENTQPQRQLIGWLQVIHVDKRIIRQKRALLKDLFLHIEKSLGHLFHGAQDPRSLMVVCGFVKNGVLVDARAYHRTGHKAFSKANLEFMKNVQSKSDQIVIEQREASSEEKSRQPLASLNENCELTRMPSLRELGIDDLKFDDLNLDVGQTSTDEPADESFHISPIPLEKSDDLAADAEAVIPTTACMDPDELKWFNSLCKAGQVPDNVRRGAISLFGKTFPIEREGNPTALLMEGREAGVTTDPSSSSSNSSVSPLLSCSQHQVACLRLAYKFIDDLYPQLTPFNEVVEQPPSGHNPKNWWRLAETAIMVKMNWQLHTFFRDLEETPKNVWWE